MWQDENKKDKVDFKHILDQQQEQAEKKVIKVQATEENLLRVVANGKKSNSFKNQRN